MAGGCYCYDTMMSGNDSRACGSPCEGKCRYEATGYVHHIDVAKAKQDSQARPYEWFRQVAEVRGLGV